LGRDPRLTFRPRPECPDCLDWHSHSAAIYTPYPVEHAILLGNSPSSRICYTVSFKGSAQFDYLHESERRACLTSKHLHLNQDTSTETRSGKGDKGLHDLEVLISLPLGLRPNTRAPRDAPPEMTIAVLATTTTKTKRREPLGTISMAAPKTQPRSAASSGTAKATTRRTTRLSASQQELELTNKRKPGK
jgi:hypothetical protein